MEFRTFKRGYVTILSSKIARQILKNSVIGPGGAKVPNNEDYLHSFIYHCVYHKGYTSGIKSVRENYKTRVPPDNDYTAHIYKLAKLNSVHFDQINLEMLDEYMEGLKLGDLKLIHFHLLV